MKIFNFGASASYLNTFQRPLENLAMWLAVLWIVQATATISEIVLIDEWLVRVVPALIFVIFALAGFRLVRYSAVAFFTPLPVFFSYSAVIFGIGPLFLWLGPESLTSLPANIFPDDVSAYVWVALLNTTGLLLTVVGVLVMMRFIKNNQRKLYSRVPGRMSPLASSGASGRPLFTKKKLLGIGYSLVALALALRFARYGLGLALDLPGFLSFVDHAGWVAVLVLGIVAGRHGGYFLVLASVVAIAESGIGLMIGIRTEAVSPLALLVIGYYVGSRSVKGLVLGVLVVGVVLTLVTPVVRDIRAMTWSGDYEGGRIAAVSESVNRQMNDEDDPEDQAIYALWNRLDYSPWQAAMMELYDGGNAGNTYRYIIWSFVPRFLAPNKPRFDIGHEIGFAVQGVSGSSSFSSTAYGEMYWNGGWLSVSVSSLVFGLLLGIISAGCLWLFLQQSVPAALLGLSGVLYGFVVDETFSVSVVGQAVIFLLLLAIYSWTRDYWYRRKSS